MIISDLSYGSASEWAGAVITAFAIALAAWQFTRQQRAQQLDQRDRNLQLDRAAVAGISAWLEWPDDQGARPVLAIANYAEEAIFGWRAYVLPSTTLQVAARVSVGDRDTGPLRPQEVMRVSLDEAHASSSRGGVASQRIWFGARSEFGAPARFVALDFVDGVGREWLRANNYLRRVPNGTGLWDSLIHVHNFRLQGAGLLAQYDWSAALYALSDSSGLPDRLETLAATPDLKYDWCDRPFWIDREMARETLNRLEARSAVRRARDISIQHSKREGLTMRVDPVGALNRVKRFLNVVATTSSGAALFIRGD